MSNLVKCDGPGCDQTRDPNIHERRVADGPWIRVEEDPHGFDFHNRDCLIRWAGEFTDGRLMNSTDLLELRVAWGNPPPSGPRCW